MKKVLVASFPRSGTHFLINSISSNFDSVDDGWIDVVHSKRNRWVNDVTRHNVREKISEQLLLNYPSSSVRKCVKTHYQMYFFERFLEQLLEHYDVFYAIRDPRDVMVACHHFYNRTNFEHFVKEENISAFIRAPLWEVKSETSPFSFSHTKARNIVDKWQKHIISWMPYRNKGVNFIRFEDMKFRYEETLRDIEAKSSQRLKGEIKVVTIQDKRYRPDFCDPNIKRGEVGNWRSVLCDKDVQFIEESLLDEVKGISMIK